MPVSMRIGVAQDAFDEGDVGLHALDAGLRQCLAQPCDGLGAVAAMGHELGVASGHAIEARIYAEDPVRFHACSCEVGFACGHGRDGRCQLPVPTPPAPGPAVRRRTLEPLDRCRAKHPHGNPFCRAQMARCFLGMSRLSALRRDLSA